MNPMMMVIILQHPDDRYMRYIPLKPQRLYCPTCKETYGLPQNGTIKLYKEIKCPLDQFELVVFSLGNTEKAQGKSYPLCPFCYNQPPQFVHEADLVTRNSTHDSISMHHGLQVEEGVITVFKGLDISADEASNVSSSPSDCSSREFSLQAVTTSSSRAAATAAAAMPDIEDHGGGVMIKRRFKEGVKVEVKGTGGIVVTSIASTPSQNNSPVKSTHSSPGSLSVADHADDDEAEEQLLRHMGCNSCIHPTCKQGLIANSICRCPNTDSNAEQCDGLLVLDVNSKPNWKLACNVCNTLIRFRAEIHLITPQMQCSECGVRTAIFEFNKNKTPLPNGKVIHVGCIVCDEFLNSLTEVVAGRSINLQVLRQERHRRGGRGRGRGRGGRGKGRSGARKGDVKMSFSDF